MVIDDIELIRQPRDVQSRLDSADKAILFALTVRELRTSLLGRHADVARIFPSRTPHWNATARSIQKQGQPLAWKVLITSEEVRPGFYCAIEVNINRETVPDSARCWHERK